MPGTPAWPAMCMHAAACICPAAAVYGLLTFMPLVACAAGMARSEVGRLPVPASTAVGSGGACTGTALCGAEANRAVVSGIGAYIGSSGGQPLQLGGGCEDQDCTWHRGWCGRALLDVGSSPACCWAVAATCGSAGAMCAPCTAAKPKLSMTLLLRTTELGTSNLHAH